MIMLDTMDIMMIMIMIRIFIKVLVTIRKIIILTRNITGRIMLLIPRGIRMMIMTTKKHHHDHNHNHILIMIFARTFE